VTADAHGHGVLAAAIDCHRLDHAEGVLYGVLIGRAAVFVEITVQQPATESRRPDRPCLAVAFVGDVGEGDAFVVVEKDAPLGDLDQKICLL
jgi:hypothetical protein